MTWIKKSNVKNCTSYSKLIVKSIIEKAPLRIDNIPEDLIAYAKKNKVLYLIGSYDKRIRNLREWCKLNRKRKEQYKTIVEVVQLAKDLGLKILIVKTLKPFNYVPDDIDILTIEEEDLQTIMKYLIQKGFIIHKKGTPEITLRKTMSGITIYLDAHIKMGAGSYEYIDKWYLWKRRAYKRIINEDIPVPGEVDEILITAAHAVMKELRITLADVIHIISSNKHIIGEARLQSARIGLLHAFNTLLRTAYVLLAYTFNLGINREHLYLKFPMRVPMISILRSYKENLIYRLTRQGSKPLNELIRIPTLRGPAALLRYIGL